MLRVGLLDGRDRILGYYVADDEELDPSPDHAAGYDDAEGARADADHGNRCWNLAPGERFVALRPSSPGRFEAV